MSTVSQVKFAGYGASVAKALDLIKAADRLPREGLIIIKPNLTNADPPPVTTNVKAAEAVYEYCRDRTRAEIAVGEGCGEGVTSDVFEATGYAALAKTYCLRLIDFNQEKTVVFRRQDVLQLTEFYMPEIVEDAFVISLPVLKDHSLTMTTVAMKNMFGIAPAPFYRGSWNKSKLHSPSTHKSVVDVCLYKKPDLCVVDAVVANVGSHISGSGKRLGLILASFDPVAVDTVASELLGHDPRKIQYLTLANGRLGSMESVSILHG